VGSVASGQVLIVSADARWLRVLEVTIRLGGAETISRHSVSEMRRTPPADGQHPTAIVVDLGAQSSPAELEEVRVLVRDRASPAVVILPERLAAERGPLTADGATVLVRPYRPSELYAALWPDDASPAATVRDDDPLTVDAGAADGSPRADDAIAPDPQAGSTGA
jgi:hypothetical protein